MARAAILTGLGSTKASQQGLQYHDPGPISPNAFGAGIAQGLGELGDTLVSVGLQTQGPLDVVSVQKNQLNVSLGMQKWIDDNAAIANQPDYPQLAQEAFRSISEQSQKQLETEGYRPSTRAKNAMSVDNLQAYKTYGSMVLEHHDTARKTMIAVDTEANLDKARSVAISSGDMNELDKQTSFASHAAKATLSPEQFAAFEETQKQKNGAAVVANLNDLQESTLRPGTSQADLEASLTQGQAQMQQAVQRGWIDPAKGDEFIKQWETNFEQRHFHALTLPEQEKQWSTPQHGQPGNVDDRIIQIESGGDPNTPNKAGTSNALGLGQFIPSTWRQFITERHPDRLAQGEDIQKLRTDPALAREAVGWYREKNTAELQAAGLPVTPGNIYLAHFLGPGGAKSLLSANPGASASSVLGADQVAANQSILAGKTVSEVVAWADAKMAGASTTPQLTGPYAGIPSDRQADMYHQMLVDQMQADTQRRTELSRMQAQNNDIFAYNIAAMTQGGPPVLPSQVNDAVQGGLIDPGQGAALIGKINEMNGFTLETQRAVSAFNAGEPGNALDPQSSGKVNKAFDWISEHTDPKNIPTLVDGAVARGVFPNKVRYALEQGFTSPDPAALGQTAALMQRYANDPNASRVLGSTDWGQELLKKANVAQRMAELYGTDRANQMMAGWNAPDRRIEVASLEPRLKKQLEAVDIKAVTSIPGFDTSNIPGVGTPTISTFAFQDQMVADLKMFYEQEFYAQRGGDPQANGADILARAQTDLSQIYGLSQLGTGAGILVGQGELVKYPIEKAPGYTPIQSSLGGDGYNYIRENVAQHVLEFNGGTMDRVVSWGLVPIEGVTAGDWAAKSSMPSTPSMPAGTNVPANPHYWIQVKREDAYGHAVFDRLPQAWNMPEGEIRQSNDWKVREANRRTAEAKGRAGAVLGRERGAEVRKRINEVEQRNQELLKGMPTSGGLTNPLQDTPIPTDTTQAPGQY